MPGQISLVNIFNGYMINFKSIIINIGDIVMLEFMVSDILLPSNIHFLN